MCMYMYVFSKTKFRFLKIKICSPHLRKYMIHTKRLTFARVCIGVYKTFFRDKYFTKKRARYNRRLRELLNKSFKLFDLLKYLVFN